MFTGAIAGHVRNLLELHRAASRIRPHPPGGHLAHPPCRLNDLKGFTRLGSVFRLLQSVLGSSLLCGKRRSRSLVGNLTSPNDGHSSHSTFVTLIGILSVRPKGVAVEVGLRKALCPDEWRAPDAGLRSGEPSLCPSSLSTSSARCSLARLAFTVLLNSYFSRVYHKLDMCICRKTLFMDT